MRQRCGFTIEVSAWDLVELLRVDLFLTLCADGYPGHEAYAMVYTE